MARKTAEALTRGGLQHAPCWGKPVPVDEGREQTPASLRMPFWRS
jgi:hypothetical protein